MIVNRLPHFRHQGMAKVSKQQLVTVEMYERTIRLLAFLEQKTRKIKVNGKACAIRRVKHRDM